jgi:hypothetical protein
MEDAELGRKGEGMPSLKELSRGDMERPESLDSG